MGTNNAPLVADLVLFCSETDVMSLSDDSKVIFLKLLTQLQDIWTNV